MNEFETDQIPEIQEMEIPAEPVKRKLNWIWVAVAVVGVALLGAAAFWGARLVNVGQGGGLGGGVVNMNGQALSAGQVSVELDKAKELPDRKSDATGVVSEIKDRSLFVRTGNQISVVTNGEGETEADVENEGPTVEVVVTDDTKIYRDITSFDDLSGKSGKIAQKLDSVNYSEIVSQSVITVWGSKRGDRLIADVIIFNSFSVTRK
jgi:hypothetical protein